MKKERKRMKKFEAVTLLIADGTEDSAGTPNGTPAQWELPELADNEFLSVRLDFDIRKPVGRASNFRWQGEVLLANLEISLSAMKGFKASIDGRFPCVGGVVKGIFPRGNGDSLPKYELQFIGLCENNGDKRIPALKEK